MKKLFVFLCGLLLASAVWAAPFINLKRVVTQPDGTTLELYLSGNEYANRLHDADDYSVMRGTDGYYYYAVNDAAGNVVPSAHRVGSVDPAGAGIPKRVNISQEKYKERMDMYTLPVSFMKNRSAGKGDIHEGTLNNIVVLISFADDDEFQTPRKDVGLVFNGENRESLKDYYQEVSYGRLTINSTLFPVCDPEKNLSYKDSEPRATFEGNPGAAVEQALLKRALDALRPQIEAAYTAGELDMDGDGSVDNMCFVIRGASGEWNTLLWAHKHTLYTQTVMLHDKRVLSYVLQPEDALNVRTTCHEMNHVLGAPDLYIYNSDIPYAPVEQWDLMEHGMGHISAYVKWKYANQKWIKDIPAITESGRYSLKPLGSGDEQVCYRLDVSPESDGSQCLVLEYRKKAGRYEKNIPESGLLVYRILQTKNGNASAPYEVYVYRPGGTDVANGEPAQAALNKESGRTRMGRDTDPAPFLTDSYGHLNGYADIEISDVSEGKSDEIFFTVKLTPATMDTIRVKPGGTGNGGSWEQAMGSLQQAVNSCNAKKRGEIWLAGGTYEFPDDTLYIREFSKIYGGFAGTERSKEERDMEDRNGNGMIDPWEYTAVSRLVFSGKGRLVIPEFSASRSVYCNGLTLSGLSGSFNLPATATFSGMEICNNTLPQASETSRALIEISDGILEKSYLHHNSGENALLRSLNGDIRNCVIANNHSLKSSIVCLEGGAFRNCLAANNETGEAGGISVDRSIPDMINNTIVHNRTQNTTGWLVAPHPLYGKIMMYNTLLWGNMPAGASELAPAGVYRIQGCAVQGFNAADYDGRDISEVGYNIRLEAEAAGSEAGKYYAGFKSASPDNSSATDGWTGRDWRCGGNSACIDNGRNGAWVDADLTDLAGNIRAADGKVDIGAYENIIQTAATVALSGLEKIYSGQPQGGTVKTEPEGLKVAVYYDGVKELPVEGGTYVMEAVVTAPAWEGGAAANFVIAPAEQAVEFKNWRSGSVAEGTRVLHAAASSGLPVVLSSSDASVVEIQDDTVAVFKQAGNVTITASQAGNRNYKAVSASLPMAVAAGEAVVTLSGLHATFDGSARAVAVATVPEGLACRVAYNGSAEAPVHAGKYAVEVVAEGPGYAGYAADTLIIEKAAVQIEIAADSVLFDGAEQWPEVRTVPQGLALRITANGAEKAPRHAGAYHIAVTVDDPDYQGSAASQWVIKRAPAELHFAESDLRQVFDERSYTVNVTAQPADRIVDVAYLREETGFTGIPYWAGRYRVTASVDEVDYYAAPVVREMVIEKAPMTITIDRSALEQTYTGRAVMIGAATSPKPGLAYEVRYNGTTAQPVNAGAYQVVAEIREDWSYQGSDTATLVIRKAAQSIAFDQKTDIKYQISGVALEAVSSAGLPVAYTSSDPSVASIDGTRLVFRHSGTTVVTASQSGNANYEAAEPVALTFTVIPLTQTLVWDQEPGAHAPGGEPLELTARATSGLAVS